MTAPNIFRNIWCHILCLWLSLAVGRAAEISITNYLALGERAEATNDVATALRYYTAADQLNPTNSGELCVLTRRYCDLMHVATSPDTQKLLAERALAAALRAMQANPKNATAQLCVAVSYAKNFPYADNETKVKWSKAIKKACETAIALDAKQDVGYYLLGRWHFGVANMGFFSKSVVMIVYGGLPRASNEEAIKNFQQAIVIAPDRIIHHFELAKTYQALNQNILARAELEKCVALKPIDRDDADALREAKSQLAQMQK
jgi:tetratricopeptide (TPR) repeat protein